jgi:ketosteroid isomerase-like protein
MEMWNSWGVGLVLLVMSVACGSVSAASPDEIRVRQELQGWYGKIVDSYRKKDMKAYMALYTQDVRIRDLPGRTKDRKALEASAREDMAATGEIHSAELEIRKLEMKGQEATIDCIETWKYVFTDLKGEFGHKGRAYNVVWRSPARIRFLKSSHGWLAKSKEVTGPETLTAEGRPLVPLVQSRSTWTPAWIGASGSNSERII